MDAAAHFRCHYLWSRHVLVPRIVLNMRIIERYLSLHSNNIWPLSSNLYILGDVPKYLNIQGYSPLGSP
jgi:hypothetical protein